jgi:exodeoxyribonuclease-3
VASIPGGALRVASAYVPNGQEVGSDKFAYKLRFYDRLRTHWQTQITLDEIAVLGGDFNCAPAPIDVNDPSALDGSVCYHPDERAKLRALMYLGLHDAFRLKHPDVQQFSWWDYRGGGFERGHGLRIDHLLMSARAMDRVEKVWMDPKVRALEKPSDHIPVLAKLDIHL